MLFNKDNNWYEINLDFLNLIGYYVEDPKREERYHDNIKWGTAIPNLDKYFNGELTTEDFDPSIRSVLASFTLQPISADLPDNISQPTDPQQLWLIQNGRHRLTSIWEENPRLLVPIKSSLFSFEEETPIGKGVLKDLAYRLASSDVIKLLPKTTQNQQFIHRCKGVSLEEIRYPTPSFPIDIQISGRRPDLVQSDGHEDKSIFLWASKGQVLIVLDSSASIYGDQISGTFRTLYRRFSEVSITNFKGSLQELLSKSKTVTIIFKQMIIGMEEYRFIRVHRNQRTCDELLLLPEPSIHKPSIGINSANVRLTFKQP